MNPMWHRVVELGIMTGHSCTVYLALINIKMIKYISVTMTACRVSSISSKFIIHRNPMLDWFVDELVLDVFREVLDELDVATVEQLANTLLDSLDILRLSLQLLSMLV